MKRLFTIFLLVILLVVSWECAFADPEPLLSVQIQTIRNDVNLRAEASAQAKKVGSVNKGTGFEVISEAAGQGGEVWYEVLYQGEPCYILGDMVEVVEYIAEDEAAKPAEPSVTSSGNSGGNGSSGGGKGTCWIPVHGGKKYHSKSSCSGMKGPKNVTLEEAVRRGFTKCKKCW